MDYCSIVWGGSPHVKKINLSKKRAARVILDITDNRYLSKDMFLTKIAEGLGEDMSFDLPGIIAM
jgi:hypothetical protein